MKIANKITSSFFVVVAILVATAISIFYMAGKTHLQKAIYAHLSTTAHSRAHHIETFLKTQKNAATQISQSIVLKEFLSAGKEDPDYIQRFNRAMRRLKATEKANEFTSELFVIDKNGKIAVSSDRSKIGLDKSTDSYFLGGKKGTYIKDAYYSKTMAEKCLVFSAPIEDSNTGEFLGVIVAKIKMDMLNEITTDRTGLGETGELYLVNKYGYMITPSRFRKDVFLKQKIDTENTRKFFEDLKKYGGKTHPHEAFIYRDYRGVKVLGVHDHIHNMQWCLCAEIDKQEALAPLAIIKLISIIIFCAVLGIIWSAGTLVSRVITAPINRLHKGIKIIGQGNLDYKVGTDVKDEIGQLSRAFDEMSENLGQRTTSIDKLNKEITERKQAEAELKAAQKKLIETARTAGMAEVAADILHNVGNVLNSINVSTTVIREKVTSSELANLEKVASIINEHIDDLGTFLTKDPQGKHIPVYLTEVSKCLQSEQTDIIDKLKVLTENVQHIKDIVGMQQDYTKVSGVEVQTSLSTLAEDAIQINSAGLERHGTRLIREFEELGDVEINKQKVLQILVNLISNAKYALSGCDKEEKLLTIRIYKHSEDRFRIEVADNGVGISEDNLTKIFSHGFTTKEHGHGFGLHSSALAAKEMRGSLTVHSEGVGQGATFTLELPFKPVKVRKDKAEVTR